MTCLSMRSYCQGVEIVTVKRGDIFYADLNPTVGSEQGGVRPVLVIQNDIGNTYSPTTVIAAVTSRINRPRLPTHVAIGSEESGLPADSVVLLEQIRTVDKSRLKDKVSRLPKGKMAEVDRALEMSLGLVPL
jgi:mRNA interferase MazF